MLTRKQLEQVFDSYIKVNILLAQRFNTYFPSIKAVVVSRSKKPILDEKNMENIIFVDIPVPAQGLNVRDGIKDFITQFPFKLFQLEAVLMSAPGVEIPHSEDDSQNVILFAARDISHTTIHTVYYHKTLEPTHGDGMGVWVPRGQEAQYIPGAAPFHNGLLDEIFKQYILAVSMPKGL